MIFLTLLIFLLVYATASRVPYTYILSPTSLVIIVFILSLLVSALNYDEWGDISSTTMVTLFISIISFVLGCRFVSIISPLRLPSYRSETNLSVSSLKIYCAVIFMLVVTYFDYLDIRRYADVNVSNVLLMVAAARKNSYIEQEAIKHSFIILHALYLCKAMAYVFLYVFFYRRIILKSKYEWRLMIPVVVFFFQSILSTGRTEFIYLMYTALLYYFILNQSLSCWTDFNRRQYYRPIVIAFLLFIAIFLYMASVRGGEDVDLVKSLCVYIGSPIKALSMYIEKNGIWATASFFGEQTQVLLYSILQSLGASSHAAVVVMSPIELNGNITNIYTATCRYLHDYGILGMMVVMFAIGYIYTSLFNKIITKNDNGIRIIFYAFISYPLVEMSIEERFFSNLLTARSVFIIIYIYLFYRYLFGVKTKKNKRNEIRNNNAL